MDGVVTVASVTLHTKKREERGKTVRDFYLFNLGGRTKV